MFGKIRIVISKLKSGILDETKRVLIGWKEIRRLQKKYGRETHIIFMRGATGDTYLQLLLLEEYVKQKNIKKFILAGDARGIEGLCKIFSISEYELFSIYIAECIEKTYVFLDGKNINMRMFFLWSNGFKHNPCRVRMTEKYNFMDSYINFTLGLKEPVCFRKPHFTEVHEDDYWRWQKQGIVKGRTIIVAPDANSVTGFPVWFWNSIIMDLHKAGYNVFVNCNYFNFYRTENIFFSYKDSVPLLEYAGYFVAIRSGLCDIISTAKCKKIIIYPKQQKEIDYSEHRTEKEFSGLEVMGLVKDDIGLREIDTPLIRNITDKNTLLEGTEEYFEELSRIRNEIFEVIGKEKVC